MPMEITVDIYRYDELNKIAKCKARDNWVNNYSWQWVSDDTNELCKAAHHLAQQINCYYVHEYGGIYVNYGKFYENHRGFLEFLHVEPKDDYGVDEAYALFDIWNDFIDSFDETPAILDDDARELAFAKLDEIAKTIYYAIDGYEVRYSENDFVEEQMPHYGAQWFYVDGVEYHPHVEPKSYSDVA